MSKYEPLSQFLERQPASRVSKGFDDLEEILGFSLPRSAKAYEAWWSNNATGHSHARAWLDAGWKTEALDLQKQQVTFVRTSAERHPARKFDPWGCMAGTITISPDIDLTAPSGDAWNAERGLLLDE